MVISFKKLFLSAPPLTTQQSETKPMTIFIFWLLSRKDKEPIFSKIISGAIRMPSITLILMRMTAPYHNGTLLIQSVV
ncbi:MAG TPA: hypothetical protein VMW10_04330 [Alphaproteobacteria bacterium]|nr:hypothetical protein [Alphaproteobacteria bacterium]